MNLSYFKWIHFSVPQNHPTSSPKRSKSGQGIVLTHVLLHVSLHCCFSNWNPVIQRACPERLWNLRHCVRFWVTGSSCLRAPRGYHGSVSSMVVIVSQCIHVRMWEHHVVYLNYMWFFICQVYLSKAGKKKKIQNEHRKLSSVDSYGLRSA